MFKVILKYVGLTISVAVVGGLTLALSLAKLPTNREPSGPSLFLLIAGVFLVYGSPVIAAFWYRYRRHKASLLAVVIENERLREVAATNEHQRIETLRRETEEYVSIRLQRRFLERQRLIDSIDQHRTALTRNLERAIQRNDYGVVTADQRHDALAEFFASIKLDKTSINYEEAGELVFEQLALRISGDRLVGFDANDLPFDGHAFERWVAEGLAGYGWSADVTPGSGDQGIDVIAERNGHRLGLQCKLFSSAIGNKAVQEAHAGKAYYGVDAVGVISNAKFTRSAQDLAISTGVKLLSHQDIPLLYEKIFVGG
jgi:hypothetical protein